MLWGAAVITLTAAFIRGLTGFGMAIVLVPLLSLMIPPSDAVVLAIFLQLLIGALGLRKIWANADRKSAIPITLTAMIATPVGMLLLEAIAPDQARFLIAAVAIAAFAAVLIPQKQKNSQPQFAIVAASGLASGILTGFAAMPGPPVVPFYMRYSSKTKIARASMMLVFFGTAIAGTLASLWIGLGSRRLMLLSLFLFAPMWLGNHLGAIAFGRVPPRLWRPLIGTILGIAGAFAALRLTQG